MTVVAITSTPGRASVAGRAAARVGFDVALLPSVVLVPGEPGLRAAAANVARNTEVIVLTSGHAVDVVWGEGAMPRSVDTLAVGSRTAEAVRRRGGRVNVVGSSGLAALLDVATGGIEGRSVVYPRAADAPSSSLARLASLARFLFAPAVYAVTAAPPPRYPSVNVAWFASPSAVTGWSMSRSLEGVQRVAIGPTTAAALERAGSPPHAVATEPSYEAMADATAALMRSPVR